MTHFLPDERDGDSDLHIAAEVFRASGFDLLLDHLPLCTLALNDKRQIIYANPKFYEFVEADRLEDVLGARAGEALGCIHPSESEGGCGATRFCRYCGAARAMLHALEGASGAQECSIMRRFLNRLEGLNLQVWTTPLSLGGRLVILFSVIEIGHEKTLENVSVTFFQELMARLDDTQGFAGMLDRGAGGTPEDILGRLRAGLDSTQRLVQTQKDFFDIEKSRYLPVPSRFEVRDLLSEVVRAVERLDVARGRGILLSQVRYGLTVESDRRLLANALAQLLINALEAVKPGGQVGIGCEEREGQVVFTVSNPGDMPEPVRMRMFKRSFTTKGEGRGMGSYLTKLAVENYLDGTVDFISGPGFGTVFFIQIPALG